MKATTKKSLATIVTFMFSLSLLLTNGVQKVNAETKVLTKEELRLKALEQTEGEVKVGDKFSGLEQAEFDTENVVLQTEGNPEETIRVIVEVSGQPAITKFSTIDEDNINSVIDAQAAIQAEAEEITDNEVKNSYGNLINGFSIDVKRKDVEELANIPGVVKVTEAIMYYPDMATAVDLTEVTKVWEEYGYDGEGLVVSIIDTGIDYNHKDMRLSNPENAKITDTNPEGPGKYYTEKVPYGYNFADQNDEVRDTTSSMHGMHVGGIVGANATDEDVVNGTGIRGVAPEAQLLAMKVFTNDPEISGAYSDDIIAAIEDSVLHGADIINMSLGSTAGYRDSSDPQQIAIKNATDAGTIVVVSAGNSTYSTYPYWFGEIKDIGLVGSPGLAEDALQVASYENNYVKLSALKLFNGEDVKLIGYTDSDILPSDVFNEEDKYEVVYCGLGQESDVADKDLTGKVALVQRGEIAFTDKVINAQAKGAIAVIVYNNAGDAYINMATDPKIKVPHIFVTQSDGEKIKSAIESEGRVGFGNYQTTVLNSEAGKLSSFTSWGSAPNLDFAPQITGPGGNIYSTLNNNSYGTMSGTSMSSPHVAGATALIVQALKTEGVEFEGRDLVEFVKNSIINTAEVLYDTEMYDEEDEMPYSPRRQGSGMIQTKAAIDNRVLALADDGKATVALKEIGNTTTFNLTLTNYGDSDEAYTLESLGGVLTAINPGFGVANYMVADEPIEGATIEFDKNEVTVPANGQVTVTATLNIPEGTEADIFAEGFVKFINKNEEAVSLVVPFMGFYGDWSAERIINDVAWDFNAMNILPASFSVVQVLGGYNYAGYVGRDQYGDVVFDPNIIAISPNNDEYADAIIPAIYPLRNAKSITVDVLDKDGNVIAKNVNSVEDVRKKVFNTSNGSGQQASISRDLLWDGTLYNKSIGEYETAPEGQYYVRLNSKVDIDTATEQSLVIPVKVDLQEPEINFVSENTSEGAIYNLQFELNEELSGLQDGSLVVGINGKYYKVPSAVIVDNKVSLNVELENNELNTIEVGIYDNAYNFGYASMEVLAGEIPYEEPTLTLDIEEGQEFVENNITINGVVTGDYSKVVVAGQEVTPAEDGTFSIDVVLEEGKNYISKYVEDVFGKVVVNFSTRVLCDTQAPVITLSVPVVSEDNVIVTPVNGIVLRGTVSDNTLGYNFTINGEKVLAVDLNGGSGHDATRQEFYKELDVVDGDIITLNATDLFGHETVVKYTVKVDAEAPVVEVINAETEEVVDNNGVYSSDVTPVVNVVEGFKVVAVTLNGEEYDGAPITEDGKYTLVATIGLDREVEGRAVEDTVNYVVNFEIDKTAPVVTIEGVADGLSYNHEVTPVVTVNEEATVEYKLNGEAYELTTITEEGQYTLEVVATDKVGNVSTTTVTFVIDKTAPVITIDDVVNGMKYDKEVKPVVSVDDENAEVVVTLNDNGYDGSVIKTDGKYTLKVVATDTAGNVSEKTVSFEIKFPEKDTTNPTPTPDPGDGGGSDIGGGTTNDGQGNGSGSGSSNNGSTNVKPSVTKPGKGDGNLPSTGQDRVIYIAGFALILVAVGGVLVLKKKKVKEEK